MPNNWVDTHMYQCISEEAVASIILWKISRLPYLPHSLMAHPTSILLRITRFIHFFIISYSIKNTFWKNGSVPLLRWNGVEANTELCQA